ncbi:MAG: hypothetical protein ICV63_03780 [Coleofasciculus sp. Co-bin14]|nr:hypothetical protein [Coleofasciculus sp. Co-bin14]
MSTSNTVAPSIVPFLRAGSSASWRASQFIDDRQNLLTNSAQFDGLAQPKLELFTGE